MKEVYYTEKDWLLLVESVTSHGPVDGKRRAELGRLFAGSRAGLVYVTAFPNRGVMGRYLGEVAWETEVWVADAPSHLIHFNGVRRSEEIETFARLDAGGRLGRGECSAIAVAVHRGFNLAVEDRRARAEARALSEALHVFDTREFVLDMIRVGAVSITEADALKERWHKEHRFRLSGSSFAHSVS